MVIRNNMEGVAGPDHTQKVGEGAPRLGITYFMQSGPEQAARVASPSISCSTK